MALRCLQSSNLQVQPVSTDLPLSLAAAAAAAAAAASLSAGAASPEPGSKAGNKPGAKAGSKAGKARATSASKEGKTGKDKEEAAGQAAGQAAAAAETSVPAPGLASEVRRVLAQSRDDIAQLARDYYAAKDPARPIRCAGPGCGGRTWPASSLHRPLASAPTHRL
jgi:hypothetical protein